ncbi:MAG: two-component sensor histidine kinase [Oscillospiraceae bacterium]|nr:two-component sensor histidine kinase [Oscillospiraceae bacterium]
MIQKLRRKFIATNMFLVSLVLLAVFSIQAFSTYRHALEQIVQAQSMALRWISLEFPFGFEFGRDHRGGGQPPERGFPAVPVFAVEIDAQGQIIALREGPGSTVTQETAQELVTAALSRKSSRGNLPGLSLSYLSHWENDRHFFAFADNQIILISLRNQLLTSLLICTLALIGFYLISRFLSRLSLRPVEQAWEQQRQFVADASHELKTPITVILANTGILRSHPADSVAEQVKWIDYIQDEAVRMKGLVDDLLFLAKSDAARLPFHPAVIRLDQLVIATLLSFEPVAFEAGVALKEDISPDISVLGDEDQLRRLVVILLDNGVKYAGSQGIVTLRLDRLQDRPRLSVHNTGPAIPPEHLPHLFERFYRTDVARDRSQGGYGLGLSIAKSIAEGHQGKLTVTSSPAEGTTFSILFPKK